jgi:hypothetical protein
MSTKTFKHGDTREDGYRFWGYRWNDTRTSRLECWYSPEAFQRAQDRNQKQGSLVRVDEQAISATALMEWVALERARELRAQRFNELRNARPKDVFQPAPPIPVMPFWNKGNHKHYSWKVV